MKKSKDCKVKEEKPLTLDEAIAHAEERINDTPCGRQHKQLADWLKELREMKQSPIGNVAALREALENLKDEALTNYDLHDYPIAGAPVVRGIAHCVAAETILDEIKSALSKPARNCDLFGGDKEKLHAKWWEWTGTKDGLHDDGSVKLTFGEWLLEEADKKLGDGIIPEIEKIRGDNEALLKTINHILDMLGKAGKNPETENLLSHIYQEALLAKRKAEKQC